MFQSAKVQSASLVAAYLLSLSQPTLGQLLQGPESTDALPNLPKVETLVTESKEYQLKRTAFELAKTLAAIKETGNNIEKYKELTGENSLPCDKVFDQINVEFQEAVKLFENASMTEASEKAQEVLFKQEELNSKVVKLHAEYVLVQNLSARGAEAIKAGNIPYTSKNEQALDIQFEQQLSYNKSYFRMDSDSCFDLNALKNTTEKLVRVHEEKTGFFGFLNFFAVVASSVIAIFAAIGAGPEACYWIKEKYGDIKDKLKEYYKKYKQQQNKLSECDAKISEASKLLERYADRRESLWNKESFPALVLDAKSKVSLQETFESLPKLHQYLETVLLKIQQFDSKLKTEEFSRAHVVPHFGLGEPEKANIEELIQFYKETLDQAEVALRLKA
jgi:hypothetical protein